MPGQTIAHGTRTCENEGNPVFERFQGAVVDCLLELARKIKHHHRLVSVRKEDVTHTGRGDVDGFQVSTDVLGKPRFAIIPYRIHHEQYCPGTLRLKHLHACDLPRSQSNLRRGHRLPQPMESVVVGLLQQMLLDGAAIHHPMLSIAFDEFLDGEVVCVVFHTGEVVPLALYSYFASLEIVPLFLAVEVGPGANKLFHC